jgi:hypothetical protein
MRRDRLFLRNLQASFDLDTLVCDLLRNDISSLFTESPRAKFAVTSNLSYVNYLATYLDNHQDTLFCC